jgi:hypothetical protein
VLSGGDWFAIEVTPDVDKETIEFALPEDPSGRECRSKVVVEYAWSGEKNRRDPVLFLKPTGNEFYNRIFHVLSPVPSGRADLQLDLLAGVWRGTFPNVESGGKKSFLLVPTAIARGEWKLPFHKSAGLQIALEQTVSNMGQVANLQNVFFSDWTLGAFYEMFLPIRDGLQLRGSIRYHQHTADDNKSLRSLAYNGRDARHILLGATSNLYFRRYWLAGMDLDWALPGSLAGRGSSTLLDVTARGGLRLTSFLYFLSELGYRVQGIEGAQSESLLRFQAGIRLDL